MKTERTTPESLELQALFSQMLKEMLVIVLWRFLPMP